MRPWYSWPSTPPCHGGDRRFESGRARQNKIFTPRGWIFYFDMFRMI